MSSESFSQEMDSSSSAMLLLYSRQSLDARGLTLIGVLLTVIFFSDGSIKEQAAWAEAT
jgi:hypothetical protein